MKSRTTEQYDHFVIMQLKNTVADVLFFLRTQLAVPLAMPRARLLCRAPSKQGVYFWRASDGWTDGRIRWKRTLRVRRMGPTACLQDAP